MIDIRNPFYFSEIGKKENQEDYLFPADANCHTRVFILCDGMGGYDNGEIASRTAATALGMYLNEQVTVDIETFETGLQLAYDALDEIDTNSPKKPGTTLACLCLNDNSYLVAHIGDSRIYQIRPSLYNSDINRGGIIYQSSDHSLVNDLLKAGEITEAEARDFPQKNVITRALQPHLQRRYKADVYLFDDIETGDYFFICSDGVLEQMTNDKLCQILSNPDINDNDRLQQIKSICNEKTNDNYSCWLVPIEKVEKTSQESYSKIIQANIEEVPEAEPKGPQLNKENNPESSNKLTFRTQKKNWFQKIFG